MTFCVVTLCLFWEKESPLRSEERQREGKMMKEREREGKTLRECDVLVWSDDVT